MRVLVGGPVVDTTAYYFKASKYTIENQNTDATVEISYIEDTDTSEYSVEGSTHNWTAKSISRVGALRQSFINQAADGVTTPACLLIRTCCYTQVLSIAC